MVTQEFGREFEWYTQDVGMVEKDAKIYLVLVLDQDTLDRLDAYITMYSDNKMA